MKITFSKLSPPAKGDLVVTASEGAKLGATAKALDKTTGGAVTRAIRAEGFKGRKNQKLTLLAPAGLELDRLIVIGLGKTDELDAQRFQEFGGAAYAALSATKRASAAIAIDGIERCAMDAPDIAANVATGARLRSYRFDKYKGAAEDGDNGKEAKAPKLRTLRILSAATPDAANRAHRPLDRVADGVFLTRDLVSEPANVIYPESLAKRARELEDLGVDVEVLGEKEMRKLGMNALLGVGQGSDRESKLVVMQWNGRPGGAKGKGKKAKSKDAPIAFVGKGVTFDTGGISLKPSGGMEDMKWDMGGSGVVIGLMKALAGRKARVNAVGVVGLVENMPSGKAQRPGDIVTSLSGKTIEVLNTDAEGRLVLADALWYCQGRFKPKAMIDLATLTGAILVSLGVYRAGLFANDDQLAERIHDIGEALGERVWRMPMGEEYDKLLKSDAADMKNISSGRWGGSITAAQFLERFVNDVPWVHLDIAGVTWSKETKPIVPKGGTGFGVRLLDRLVADHYESD